MTTAIFVNLPVADLAASRAFFTGVGYTINENFSNDSGICVVITESIYAMLLTPTFFQGFTPRPLSDATASTEVLLALGVDSREAVDSHLTAALAGGATETRDTQDEGFMYSRAYSDPDGHIWEILWMDPAAAETGPPAE
jgi:predicted lactoylglutathione lyase